MLRRRFVPTLAAAVVGVGLLSGPPPAAVASPTPARVSVPASASRASGNVVRVATFNVRTARKRSDSRRWLRRAPDVAREILARRPGVVALQELGPGRADGVRGHLKGHMRQTSSLTAALRRRGGGRYKLVRTTSYAAPGSAHGTQGARILYDSSRFTLLSHCPERTGRRNYNPSCAFDLPIAAGDSRRLRRAGAYAGFRDQRTGRRFFVVSAHLDHRHSGSRRLEAKYNRLRARQAARVAQIANRVNRHNWPVVFGGDINSWQTDRGRYAPHRALQARGYRDTVTAGQRVNVAYPTVNHWQRRLRRSHSGVGVRLDVLMVKGARGVRRYENVMSPVDNFRPSDHNMVVADIRL